MPSRRSFRSSRARHRTESAKKTSPGFGLGAALRVAERGSSEDGGVRARDRYNAVEPRTERPGLARSKRNYRPLLLLSLLLYASMAVAGVTYSLRSDGHLPAVTLHFNNRYVDQLIADGHADRAIQQLRLAADIELVNDQAALALVDLARRHGDLDSEIEGLRKVHQRDPRNVEGHNALSEALLRRNPIRHQDALEVIQHCEVVLQLDPSSAEAHRLMAVAFDAMGESDRAAEHQRAALRLAPDFDGAPYGLMGDGALVP